MAVTVFKPAARTCSVQPDRRGRPHLFPALSQLFEIYSKFTGSSLTPDIERTTVHVSDDTGRIAMLEILNDAYGSDGSLPVLSRYIYSNHLQSAALELNAVAEIISYEEYHPYGTTAFQAKNSAIAAVAKRYRYTGKERDEESGLYYHGARYYVPWLCKWCSVDPINNEWYNMLKGNSMKSANRNHLEMSISAYCYCSGNPIKYFDPTGEWQTDGHYWTVYLLASILNLPNAEKIAYYAEYPDTIISGNKAEERYTWANPSEQTRTHSLTGLKHADERFNTIGKLLETPTADLEEYGRLLHRLGDTYAHRNLKTPDDMYGWGHAKGLGYTTDHLKSAGSDPDMIFNRVDTNDYMNYAKDVLFVLSETFHTDVGYIDALEKATPILNSLMDYAKENNVSLIGIINYEVAKLQGKDEFYVSIQCLTCQLTTALKCKLREPI